MRAVAVVVVAACSYTLPALPRDASAPVHCDAGTRKPLADFAIMTIALGISLTSISTAVVTHPTGTERYVVAGGMYGGWAVSVPFVYAGIAGEKWADRCARLVRDSGAIAP